MSKNHPVRRIDHPVAANAGFATVETLDDVAPPALPTIPAPEDLALTTALARSAVTPTALISATWSSPVFVQPQRYAVQWSEDSGFPDGETSGVDAVAESCTIDGLKPNTLYYVRVAAVFKAVQSPWCSAVSITTEDDTVPPGPVTSAAADFTTGDLILTWVNPTSPNLKDVRVRIYASNGGTLFRDVYSTAGRYTWTAANNYLDTAGSPDPSVYVVLTARSYNNVASTDVTLSATKVVPTSVVAVTSNWDSDTLGVAAGDLVLSWTAVANIKDYVVTLDTTHIYVVTDNRFTYSVSQNQNDHSGTPDYAISFSVVARDTLFQTSTAITGTKTNAAPTAGNVDAVLAGFFSTGNVAITHFTAIADLDYYTVKLYKDSVFQSPALLTRSASPVISLNGSAAYKVGVIATDVFGRSSTEVLSPEVTIDSVTITELRSEGDYSDSISTVFTATNSATLRDNLKTAGTGIQYTSSAGWRWTTYTRQIAKVIRRITFNLDNTGASFYIGTSRDGATWRWFAGVTATNGIYILTERADEATAQSNAALMSAVVSNYIELPLEVEARYVKLGHRHASSSYWLTEFYPRSWVLADDIRGESILGIHIGANTITADRMSVSQLSAIVADLGTITAGTITGATIQTATSGARVVLSSAANGGAIGYGSGDTYNPTTGSGTYQILWAKTDGKFYFAGGSGLLDSDGMTLRSVGAPTVEFERGRSVQWRRVDTSLTGWISSLYDDAAAAPVIALGVSDPTLGGQVQIYSAGVAVRTAFSVTGAVSMSSTLQTTGSAGIGVAVASNVRLYCKGVDLTSSNYSFIAADSGGTSLLWARNDGNIMIGKSGASVGFFAGAGAVKQTVTGSRGGNAALASLLTALANYGLIVNSSSA